MDKLTWREVLDSEAVYAQTWAYIERFLPVVEKTGYRYFAWNGKIYEFISTNRQFGYKDTGLTIMDLGDYHAD